MMRRRLAVLRGPLRTDSTTVDFIVDLLSDGVEQLGAIVKELLRLVVFVLSFDMPYVIVCMFHSRWMFYVDVANLRINPPKCLVTIGQKCVIIGLFA